MNCIVVDDEVLARKTIEKYILETDSLNLVGSYSSALELINALKVKSVDLIFLDVQMPEMSGIEFVRSLRDIPQVIFVTAKSGYAVDAFENDATDYLLKPVGFERFSKAAEKALKIHQAFGKGDSDEHVIYVKSDSRLIKVDFNKITHIEALGDYVRLHTKSGKYTMLSTMKALEAKLPEKDFIRVHKSFIVKLDKILKLEKNQLFLESGVIPVSRSYKDILKSKLSIF